MRRQLPSLTCFAQTLTLFLLWVFYAPADLNGQQTTKLFGVVADVGGAPIVNADIEFDSKSGTTHTTSDESGGFTIVVDTESGLLRVSSPGFLTTTRSIGRDSFGSLLEVRLAPAPITARLDVSTTQDRIPASTNNQFAVSRRELDVAGAQTLDDVLRQVPGFSLFRRSGSLTANPTSQGVSLRGVGASGASRALVLLDGVPLNSSFGGWVYWARLARISIESVETYNGATSDLYGSGALGGVINLKSRLSDHNFFDVEASLGNKATPVFSFLSGVNIGAWSVTATGQALRTDGYVLVAEDQRGIVDTPAGTSDVSGSITLSRKLPRSGRAFIRMNLFGESRENGTPIQLNDTRNASIDLGTDWASERVGDFSFRAYGGGEVFNQNFSAVSADRNSESLTNVQHNPSQQIGAALQWRLTSIRHNLITAGVEARNVRGHSAENTFNSGRVTAHIDAGGRQSSLGLFAQDTLQFRSWVVSVGARFDGWTNRDGFSNRIPVTGGSLFMSFPERSETAFSPKLSVWRQFENGFSIGGSVYRAFRAPTLNELYRSFRAGNVVTAANASLSAERLTGGEVGGSFHGLSDRLTLRTNLFWSGIDDPVANVTLSTTPVLITRQRQNLGSIEARGVELSGTMRVSKRLEVSSEYLLTSSKVQRFPPNLLLEGLVVPQVARNQVNLQVTYVDTKWTIGVQGRFVGKQFDDDQNLLPLKKFFTLDAEAARKISARVSMFFAAQNLTGVRYEVSKTPVLTVGPPVLFRVGVRVRSSGKN
jgi:outer membrane receptor protein involved in Fe transport